jgi:hypothetical protein
MEMKKALAILLIGASLVGCSAKTEKVNQFNYEQEKDYVSYEFVVTETDGENFMGDSTNNDGTGIYFDKSYTNDDIEVGDTVIAMFEADNTEDGLVEVLEK